MSSPKVIYAQDVNYYRTGTTAPETWLEKSKAEIRAVGGDVSGEAYMERDGQRAYTLLFTFDAESYRISWPVLPLKPNPRRSKAELKADERAARIQATTFMYYDIKAKCMVVKVLGPQAAFLQYRVMADGSTPAEQGLLTGQVALPAGFRLGDGR